MSDHERIAANVMEYLKREAPEIAELVAKDLTAGDVHQGTALGNQPGSKKLSFAEILEEDKKKAKAKKVEKVTEVEYVLPVTITKIDPDQRKVFGWAYICERNGNVIVDKQGDSILPEDMEKGAHLFALESRSHGDMHQLNLDGVPVRKGDMIENMMFTKERLEKGISAVDPDTGEQLFGWFVGFKVDDDKTWTAIKAGQLPEFSIGRRGRRVES